jgi:hypothetical protein
VIFKTRDKISDETVERKFFWLFYSCFFLCSSNIIMINEVFLVTKNMRLMIQTKKFDDLSRDN